jgi:hypothetical protein
MTVQNFIQINSSDYSNMDLCTPKTGITKTNDLIFETSPIEMSVAEHLTKEKL